MAKTHIHEITQELTSLDLDGSELLVVSNPHGAGFTDYETNKLSINSLKGFINDGTSSSFGGYEMIDTSDSSNYLWSYEVGSANGNNNTRLEKQVSKDCLVWLAYYSSTAINVKIDGVPLKMEFFGGFNGSGWTYSSGYRFYIKSGQTLTVEHNDPNYNIQVFIIPLKSGGKFFFDTSKQDKFIYGELDVDIVNGQPVVQNTSTNTNIFPGQDYVDNPNNNRPKITVDCPTLFSYRYTSYTTNPAKLNDKSVVSDDIDRGFASGNAGASDPKPFICLDAGDTFEPAMEPESSSVVEWIAYPLLMSEDSGIETIKNQDKTITSNGIYTADSGFTGLGTVTVNVVNKSNIILGDGTPQTVHHNDGKLMFNSVDIQTGGNIRVGMQGVQQLIGLRYEESQNNVEYWFKPYNDLYLYIAPEGDNYEFQIQNGQYFWTAGDLIVTNSQDFPTRTNYHGIAFSPKSDLIINIASPTAEGFTVAKQATVANGKWKIT